MGYYDIPDGVQTIAQTHLQIDITAYRHLNAKKLICIEDFFSYGEFQNLCEFEDLKKKDASYSNSNSISNSMSVKPDKGPKVR